MRPLTGLVGLTLLAGSRPEQTTAMRELVGHTGYLSACKFIEGTDDMLTSSGDMSCLLWDTKTGESKHAVRLRDAHRVRAPTPPFASR